MRKTVTVSLPQGGYRVEIGSRLIEDKTLWAQYLKGRQAVVISNPTVANLYLDKCLAAINTPCLSFLIKDGEQYKNWQTVISITDFLVSKKVDRDACIIALGGGVVGDIAGFAAACYLRGVDLIQVPTTLLAQVDSSVGGKTAINHRLGKNLIGAFHQPGLVVADTDVLGSLPQREYIAGIAEVIKYGLIKDADFFSWINQHCDDIIARNHEALSLMIEKSCQWKASIVAQDEFEQGQRALLNFGHTYAHAIESLTHYQSFLHGEAVAIGLVQAALFSHFLGNLSKSDVDRIEKTVAEFGLPTTVPQALSSEAIWQGMQHDKKKKNNKIRLVLLRSLGQAYILNEVKEEQVIRALESTHYAHCDRV